MIKMSSEEKKDDKFSVILAIVSIVFFVLILARVTLFVVYLVFAIISVSMMIYSIFRKRITKEKKLQCSCGKTIDSDDIIRILWNQNNGHQLKKQEVKSE